MISFADVVPRKEIHRAASDPCNLVTALTIPCYSQRSTAMIAGAVQDQNGSAIPITVRNTATGVEREAVSNEEGFIPSPRCLPARIPLR
jgi:hypothetical protein